MHPRKLCTWLAALLLGLALPSSASAEKLRDLTDVIGARDNQLVGYGIVTGLNGTGDDASAPFAAQSLRSLLRRLGVQIDARQIRLKNVAAVIVTATIPPFTRQGQKIDVTVSSLGSAKSLRGGVLLQTPLRGGDRKTYAVAQGPLVIGGFSAAGASGSSVQEGVTTTGRIPAGALVEREIATVYAVGGIVTLALKTPDFGTTQRVVEAVDAALGAGTATALDGASIRIKAPAALRDKPVALLAKLGEIEVEPVSAARVVINERTGTVVAGGDVRLAPVAIAVGGITIRVTESKAVSQPGPLSTGNTTTVDRSQVDTSEPKPGVAFVEGAASLADVAQSLSTLGVSPRELASILQALRTAGALRAEVVVQ